MKLLQRRLLLDVVGMQTIQVKVIFFILLLLLIAAGSVQINVTTTTCKNVETLPQKNDLSRFKSSVVYIYIIL